MIRMQEALLSTMRARLLVKNVQLPRRCCGVQSRCPALHVAILNFLILSPGPNFCWLQAPVRSGESLARVERVRAETQQNRHAGSLLFSKSTHRSEAHSRNAEVFNGLKDPKVGRPWVFRTVRHCAGVARCTRWPQVAGV
jgi:hypothetical protein